MTNKSKARHGLRRNYRFKLNPTTRAIRNAFVLGVALASAGPVFAGTCTTTAPSTVECDGDFSSPVVVVVDDLTLIVGGNLPTTILPSAGNPGILAYSPSGALSVTSYADVTTVDANSIIAISYSDDVTLVNAGTVSSSTADAVSAYANGALVISGGDAQTSNSGSIDVSATATAGDSSAVGIFSVGYSATTTNSGDVTVTAYTEVGAAYAYGISVVSDSFTDLVNTETGSITASASVYSGYALAIAAYTRGSDVTNVVNAGSLTAAASADYGNAVAYGSFSFGAFSGIALSINSGQIDASASVGNDGYAHATGLFVAGDVATAINDGSITVNATTGLGPGGVGGVAVADGAVAYALFGAVYSYGDISVTATATGEAGLAIATGADSYGYFGSTVYNAGSIDATATAIGGVAVATGATSYAFFYDAYVTNTGSITATANGDYAFADGVTNTAYFYGTGVVTNTGDIIADANGTALGGARGVYNYAYVFEAVVNNEGSISASASGEEAYATGVYSVSVRDSGVLVNGGYGDVSATAAASTYAVASGAIVIGGYNAVVDNAGSISASASATDGVAYAYGAIVSGSYYAVLTNTGSIGASASGNLAFALGALVQGPYGSITYNEGSISATAAGTGTVSASEALGLIAVADSYVYVANSGSITATANGQSARAVAVVMNSDGLNVLVNSGSIVANGNGSRVAILSTSAAIADITNSGTITGSIHTGNQDDYLRNSGTWNALQTSNFGGGDDIIYNTGVITLNNSLINLGEYVVGNVFDNEGTIRVNGDSAISMGINPVDGGVETLVSMPQVFYNGGVISFLDGAANDTLTIYGDFSGTGSLSVDLNGVTGVSDKLYIEGDVISPSVQTINGTLISAVDTTFTLLPVVLVSGTSVAGNFVAGNFATPTDLFYTLGFNVVADIDATNLTPDIFSLEVEVTGLSPRGVLASTVAPGVQNLWHSSVGTVFQREGTSRDQDEAGLALWLRAFSSSGDIAPSLTRNFGTGGAQQFEQENTGLEAGIAFNFSQQFSAGLMFGKADADLEPNSGGSTEIEGDTYGVYATWTPGNGFYLDGSWRRLNFDATSTIGGGNFASNGSADGYSVEMGYGWTTAGGMVIEPQLQFSSVSVDGMSVSSTFGNFVTEDSDSDRLRLGLALRKTFKTGDDQSWTPYLAVSGVREEQGDNRYSINNSFFGDNSLAGTSTLVEAGATGQFGAWTVFGGLNWQDGDAFESVVGGQLGVRYAFGGRNAAPAPVRAPAPVPAATCASLDSDGDGVNNCDDRCPDSTAGQAIGPDGCPVPLTIDLKGVNFDFDKATLRPDGVAILDEAIAILKAQPGLRVEVAGHTDSVGSDAYNQGLSERRARTVYDYLASHGVDSSRLAGPTGYGESQPIAPNTNEDGSDNPEGRARNRRTELDVQN